MLHANRNAFGALHAPPDALRSGAVLTAPRDRVQVSRVEIPGGSSASAAYSHSASVGETVRPRAIHRVESPNELPRSPPTTHSRTGCSPIRMHRTAGRNCSPTHRLPLPLGAPRTCPASKARLMSTRVTGCSPSWASALADPIRNSATAGIRTNSIPAAAAGPGPSNSNPGTSAPRATAFPRIPQLPSLTRTTP